TRKQKSVRVQKIRPEHVLYPMKTARNDNFRENIGDLLGRFSGREEPTRMPDTPERSPMGERLLPLPLYMKIAEIGMDLHGLKTG
ncbi:hypothetical protein EJB05_14868, partial [Eragrostis curvula]